MLWNAMQIRSDIIWCLWLVIGYIWSCNPTDNRRWFAGLAISYLQSSLVLFRLWSVLALRLIALSFLIPRKSIMSSISLNLRPTDPPEIVEDKSLFHEQNVEVLFNETGGMKFLIQQEDQAKSGDCWWVWKLTGIETQKQVKTLIEREALLQKKTRIEKESLLLHKKLK